VQKLSFDSLMLSDCVWTVDMRQHLLKHVRNTLKPLRDHLSSSIPPQRLLLEHERCEDAQPWDDRLGALWAHPQSSFMLFSSPPQPLLYPQLRTLLRVQGTYVKPYAEGAKFVMSVPPSDIFPALLQALAFSLKLAFNDSSSNASFVAVEGAEYTGSVLEQRILSAAVARCMRCNTSIKPMAAVSDTALPLLCRLVSLTAQQLSEETEFGSSNPDQAVAMERLLLLLQLLQSVARPSQTHLPAEDAPVQLATSTMLEVLSGASASADETAKLPGGATDGVACPYAFGDLETTNVTALLNGGLLLPSLACVLTLGTDPAGRRVLRDTSAALSANEEESKGWGADATAATAAATEGCHALMVQLTALTVLRSALSIPQGCESLASSPRLCSLLTEVPSTLPTLQFHFFKYFAQLTLLFCRCRLFHFMVMRRRLQQRRCSARR
jgi:hypothetical protein